MCRTVALRLQIIDFLRAILNINKRADRRSVLVQKLLQKNPQIQSLVFHFDHGIAPVFIHLLLQFLLIPDFKCFRSIFTVFRFNQRNGTLICLNTIAIQIK